MPKESVTTDKAPLPIGPYSQAIKANGFVFISGQIPLEPVSGKICEGGVADQARLVLNHLTEVLKAAGSSTEKVVKTTVFLKNMNDFAAVNEVYAEYFSSDKPPARAAVEVARLPKDVLVEIEAVALTD